MVFRKLSLFVFSALVCASSVCVSAASQEEKAQLLADACLETMNVPAVKEAFKVLATEKDRRNAKKAHGLFHHYFNKKASTLSSKEREGFINSFLMPETLNPLNRAAQAKKFQMCARILIKNAVESLDVTLDAQVQAQMTTKLTEKMATQDYAPLFVRQISSAENKTNNSNIPLWRSTPVMGITSGISLGGYFLILNERWKKEVEEGTTKLSRATYITKAFFSASLNDWTTYLKLFGVGTAGVAIYNQGVAK